MLCTALLNYLLIMWFIVYVVIQNSCCDFYLSVLVCEAAVFIFSDILDTADFYLNFERCSSL